MAEHHKSNSNYLHKFVVVRHHHIALDQIQQDTSVNDAKK